MRVSWILASIAAVLAVLVGAGSASPSPNAGVGTITALRYKTIECSIYVRWEGDTYTWCHHMRKGTSAVLSRNGRTRLIRDRPGRFMPGTRAMQPRKEYRSGPFACTAIAGTGVNCYLRDPRRRMTNWFTLFLNGRASRSG
jgi:hypothetical protein